MRVALVAVAVAALHGCAGSAPTVWATAHRSLPARPQMVVYADLGALGETRLGRWVLGRAHDFLGVPVDALGALRDCGIAATRAEVVYAADHDLRQVVFMRVAGASRAAIEECAAKLLGGRPILWPGPGVFAFAVGLPPDDRALGTLTEGRGALAGDPGFAQALTAIDYGATVWGVVDPGSGSDARGSIAFNIAARGEAVVLEAHVPAGGWVRAWGMARMVRKSFARMREHFTSLTVDPEGDVIVIRASVREDQVDGALGQLRTF